MRRLQKKSKILPDWWGDDHGTSVAGVAAAVGNNSIDVVGEMMT